MYTESTLPLASFSPSPCVSSHSSTTHMDHQGPGGRLYTVVCVRFGFYVHFVVLMPMVNRGEPEHM